MIPAFAKGVLSMVRPDFIELLNNPGLEIFSIPQGRDNFAYILRVPGNDRVALVDAMEAKSITNFLDNRGWTLEMIFNTHHHYDHVGANKFFVENSDTLQVFGSAYDRNNNRIPSQTRVLKHLEKFRWQNLSITTFEIPGHTLGHFGYLVDVGNGHFFCGDTVFLGGCGRLFEGSPRQMDHSINNVIRSLGGDVSLYPAHEYSLANLEFAKTLCDEPELSNYIDKLERQLKDMGTTLPTTIAHEIRFNPFFRIRDQVYLEHLQSQGVIKDLNPVNAFGQVRALKDHF